MPDFPRHRILYTSNGIDFDEIREAKDLGVYINIDSLSNLEKFGEAFGDTIPGRNPAQAEYPGRRKYENFHRT